MPTIKQWWKVVEQLQKSSSKYVLERKSAHNGLSEHPYIYVYPCSIQLELREIEEKCISVIWERYKIADLCWLLVYLCGALSCVIFTLLFLRYICCARHCQSWYTHHTTNSKDKKHICLQHLSLHFGFKLQMK